MTVSPNPNTGDHLTLTIDYPIDPCDDNNDLPRQQVRNTVEIHDIYGSKKFSKEYTSNNISIANLRLRTGVYVVHITNVNGVKKEKMLMIE
ncbi:MAG: hypothetical protein COA67_02655 [Lutibacter sp.]|nr:MAG: hypothetical protein COA67_02655 [Lutibacter sp.]